MPTYYWILYWFYYERMHAIKAKYNAVQITCS